MYRQIKTFLVAIILSAGCLSVMAVADESAAKDVGGPAPVEARIKDLHSKLKISATQEDLFKAIAQEMRDSGTAFNEATRTREGKAKTMTAIDDLNSYANLASLHADSMKKFVAVFSPLYDSMTDDQKKNADEIFRTHKDSKKKAGGK